MANGITREKRISGRAETSGPDFSSSARGTSAPQPPGDAADVHEERGFHQPMRLRCAGMTAQAHRQTNHRDTSSRDGHRNPIAANENPCAAKHERQAGHETGCPIGCGKPD